MEQPLPGFCRYEDYVYVNVTGERIKPGHLSQAFPEFLVKHGIRRTRFHEALHSFRRQSED